MEADAATSKRTAVPNVPRDVLPRGVLRDVWTRANASALANRAGLARVQAADRDGDGVEVRLGEDVQLAVRVSADVARKHLGLINRQRDGPHDGARDELEGDMEQRSARI